MQEANRRWKDPRHLQIAVLLGLLGYGLLGLDLEIRATSAALLITTTLATEWAFVRWNGRRYDPRSPLISGLSLCLLLRTQDASLLCLAAFIAIASKFTLRMRGKHVFNPTNLALVLLLVSSDAVWVSPGQWGSRALAAAGLACAGGLVLRRAERSDVTLAFLVFWAALLFGRSAWLGEPWAIPLHRLENGALLIFAFFMLSDPRTLPDSRPGRVLFALLVACVAGGIEFVLYRSNGLLFALALCAPLVPWIDDVLPGRRFEWPGLERTGAGERPPARPFHPLPTHPPLPVWGAISRRLQ